MSGDLDGQVLSLILPNHVGPCDIKKIFLTKLLSRRNLDKIHVSWSIVSFRCLSLKDGVVKGWSVVRKFATLKSGTPRMAYRVVHNAT